MAWEGKIHDGCGKDVTVVARVEDDGKVEISGGVVYRPTHMGEALLFVKFDQCFRIDPELRNWRPCDVYTRVVGYMRRINGFNPGKKAEVDLRTDFVI